MVGGGQVALQQLLDVDEVTDGLPLADASDECLSAGENLPDIGAGPVGHLGDLPGGAVESRAFDVSADGAVVVGAGRTAEGDEAFIWDARRGMRNLRTILMKDHGLDLADWTLLAATAVSADGRAVAGTGTNPDGNREAWLAVVPGGGGR